jgi:uncharacterized protein YebE (UPF0316 family)
MIFITLFFINVCYIGAKAFQQLNVVHHNKKGVVITGMLLGLFEVMLLGTVSIEFVNKGLDALWLAIPVGLGGAVGCLVSMALHKKLRK